MNYINFILVNILAYNINSFSCPRSLVIVGDRALSKFSRSGHADILRPGITDLGKLPSWILECISQVEWRPIWFGVLDTLLPTLPLQFFKSTNIRFTEITVTSFVKTRTRQILHLLVFKEKHSTVMNDKKKFVILKS